MSVTTGCTFKVVVCRCVSMMLWHMIYINMYSENIFWFLLIHKVLLGFNMLRKTLWRLCLTLLCGSILCHVYTHEHTRWVVVLPDPNEDLILAPGFWRAKILSPCLSLPPPLAIMLNFKNTHTNTCPVSVWHMPKKMIEACFWVWVRSVKRKTKEVSGSFKFINKHH